MAAVPRRLSVAQLHNTKWPLVNAEYRVNESQHFHNFSGMIGT